MSYMCSLTVSDGSWGSTSFSVRAHVHSRVRKRQKTEQESGSASPEGAKGVTGGSGRQGSGGSGSHAHGNGRRSSSAAAAARDLKAKGSPHSSHSSHRVLSGGSNSSLSTPGRSIMNTSSTTNSPLGGPLYARAARVEPAPGSVPSIFPPGEPQPSLAVLDLEFVSPHDTRQACSCIHTPYIYI